MKPKIDMDDVKGSIASIEEYLKHAQASVDSAFAVLSILKVELKIEPEENEEEEDEEEVECDGCFELAEPDSRYCSSCDEYENEEEEDEEDEEHSSPDSPDDEYGT